MLLQCKDIVWYTITYVMFAPSFSEMQQINKISVVEMLIQAVAFRFHAPVYKLIFPWQGEGGKEGVMSFVTPEGPFRFYISDYVGAYRRYTTVSNTNIRVVDVKLYLAIFRHYASLQWRHNERDGVLNHQRFDCLLSRLFRCRSKKNINALRH